MKKQVLIGLCLLVHWYCKLRRYVRAQVDIERVCKDPYGSIQELFETALINIGDAKGVKSSSKSDCSREIANNMV